MKPPGRNDYLLFGGTFVLANKMQYVADKMVSGLSTKQWFLLRTIKDMPTDPLPTITQIAADMDTTRQNAAKMLEKLEREGLITVEESETDRRSRRVRITEAGYSHTGQVAANAQEFLKRLFEGMTHEELDTAGNVLTKMIMNLTKMQEELS